MKKLLLISLSLLLVVMTYITVRLYKYYGVSCEIYADTGIKGKVSNTMNTCLNDFFDVSKITYAEVAHISREEDGKITSIIIDSIQINKIANKLSMELYDVVEKNSFDFGIPLGSSLGLKLLSGKGPEIGVSVIPIGAVEHQINSVLISGGINQTLHRISITFCLEINCLAPFHSTVRAIESEVIIAETIIVGNVPNIMMKTHQ